MRVLVLLLIAGVARGAEQDDRDYQSLTERVKAGDRHIDFQAFRFACARSVLCNARGAPEDVSALEAARDPAETVMAGERLLAQGYPNIEAHVALAGAYGALNQPEKAEFHLGVATALLRSILDGRDGSSMRSALLVISKQEEYAILTAVGLRYSGPGVDTEETVEGGHHYTRWDVTDVGTGTVRSVYFNEDHVPEAGKK